MEAELPTSDGEHSTGAVYCWAGTVLKPEQASTRSETPETQRLNFSTPNWIASFNGNLWLKSEQTQCEHYDSIEGRLWILVQIISTSPARPEARTLTHRNAVEPMKWLFKHFLSELCRTIKSNEILNQRANDTKGQQCRPTSGATLECNSMLLGSFHGDGQTLHEYWEPDKRRALEGDSTGISSWKPLVLLIAAPPDPTDRYWRYTTCESGTTSEQFYSHFSFNKNKSARHRPGLIHQQ